MKPVMMYGSAPFNVRHAALLAFRTMTHHNTPTMHYAEHTPGGVPLAQGNRAIEARRRNETMALLCFAVIIIGRPKYAQAIVRSFQARGRRVYWYNTRTNTMHDMEQQREYAAIDRQKLPKECTFEPTIWTEQRETRERESRDFFDAHPHAQRTADQVPTYGWVEPVNDTEAKRTDICEWSTRQARKDAERDWQRRVKASGCY